LKQRFQYYYYDFKTKIFKRLIDVRNQSRMLFKYLYKIQLKLVLFCISKFTIRNFATGFLKVEKVFNHVARAKKTGIARTDITYNWQKRKRNKIGEFICSQWRLVKQLVLFYGSDLWKWPILYFRHFILVPIKPANEQNVLLTIDNLWVFEI
jgi:hypothetical protein